MKLKQAIIHVICTIKHVINILLKILGAFLGEFINYIIPIALAFGLEFFCNLALGISIDKVIINTWLGNTLFLGLIGIFFVNIVLFAWFMFRKRKRKYSLFDFAVFVISLLVLIFASIEYYIFRGYVAKVLTSIKFSSELALWIAWGAVVVLNGFCKTLR